MEALASRGAQLQAAGRPAEAASALRAAISLLHEQRDQRAHAALLSDLGMALNQAGRRREAFTTYRAALELEPTHGRAYNNFAVALQVRRNRSTKFTIAEQHCWFE